VSFRDEARRALESSVSRSTQNQHLTRIKERHPALSAFAGVEDLVGFLRSPAGDLDRKDEVLLALVEEHQRDGRSGAFAILMVAMFPALDRIYRSRVSKAQDHDELWARIVDEFGAALTRYPVARRRARVAANLECGTLKELHRSRLRAIRTETAEDGLRQAAEPFAAEIDRVGAEGQASDLCLGDFEAPGREAAVGFDAEELGTMGAALAPLFAAARLDETDQALVVGAHVHKRPLGELATELGISRGAAKARHLRAIARLRPYRHCLVHRQMYPVAG